MTPFVVIVPARLASTRLPRKPLADIGGLPMIVRVARCSLESGAQQVVVAADDHEIVKACSVHGVPALLTRSDHASGTDRLAEAVEQLQLPDDALVVNVQGDEPLMPARVVRRVAEALAERADCAIATACHPLHDAAEFFSPNVVKVVTDASGRALYFSRAPIPWSRDAFVANREALPAGLPARRHVGLYAYRAGFLRRFPALSPSPLEQHESLEQLRALAHGFGIAVVELAEALPPGVDTPDDLERVRALIAT